MHRLSRDATKRVSSVERIHEVPAASGGARSLMDLFYPGFYMVVLLRNGHAPMEEEAFRKQVRALLDSVEQAARQLQVAASDIADAKFAFCALLDEVVLVSELEIRKVWACCPMQLEFFGEHMAGERFFDKLEYLRREGASRLDLLVVYHMCLLLGFRGRYVLENSEQLDWLTARLGDEIVHMQGQKTGFAPHGAAPDRVSYKLRRDIPAWAMAGGFVVLALVAFVGLRVQLLWSAEQKLASYRDIVQLAPQLAQVTITLP